MPNWVSLSGGRVEKRGVTDGRTDRQTDKGTLQLYVDDGAFADPEYVLMVAPQFEPRKKASWDITRWHRSSKINDGDSERKPKSQNRSSNFQ